MPRLEVGSILVAGAAALALAGISILTAPMGLAASPPPSAVGDETVFGLAVSPGYITSGVVVALTTASSCTANCKHLWVTRDGGFSWKLAAGTGWDGGIPSITTDGSGREVLLAQGSQRVQISIDLGQTWATVGKAGAPSAAPDYGRSARILVAGGSSDYLITPDRVSHAVRGSGGVLVDVGYAWSPQYPLDGAGPPALLVGLDKSGGGAFVEKCRSDLSCSSPASLAGTTDFSLPVNLWPSRAFASDGTVFAQSGKFIYKSTNGGTTFTPLNVGLVGASNTATPMMALSGTYHEAGPDRTVYAALLQTWAAKDATPPRIGGGIFRSQDGGASWARLGIGAPLDGGASAVAVAPDGRLFAGYLPGTVHHSGLLCSVDGGTTWQANCPAIQPESVKRPAVTSASPAAGPRTAQAPSQTAQGAASASSPAPAGGGAVAAKPIVADPIRNRPGLALVATLILAALALGAALKLRLIQSLTRRIRRGGRP